MNLPYVKMITFVQSDVSLSGFSSSNRVDGYISFSWWKSNTKNKFLLSKINISAKYRSVKEGIGKIPSFVVCVSLCCVFVRVGFSALVLVYYF